MTASDGKNEDAEISSTSGVVSKGDESSAESQLEHIPYPKSVFFIVSNEFCERFSYYGMRTILSLYLTNILLYGEDDAKIIYHTFTMFVYFFPLFGAIISDSWLGKFRTIFYVSMIYALGNVILSLAATAPIGLPQREFSIIGLLLIAIGSGGIKPCVSAFGGDQFVLPQQELQLVTFFSLFYFSINSGSLISTFLTPVLREDVKCFGEDSCYTLAFAVPGVLMIVSIVIFGLGRPLYKIRKLEGNIVVKVTKCMGHAIKKKWNSDKPVEHWLDHAEEKYGKSLVDDIKSTLKVIVLYIPLPIFWALYDQQGSGWTFQAVRMDGDIGFYTILPDQMQVINPLLILLFIPLFTYGVYPLCAKCNFLQSPLQRMVVGGVLTAAAFGISAGISLALEATYPNLPESGQAQLRFYNPTNCNATIKNTDNLFTEFQLKSMDYVHRDIKIEGSNKAFALNIADDCGDGSLKPYDFSISEESAYALHFLKAELSSIDDNIDKSSSGLPKIRTLVDDPSITSKIIYMDGSDKVLELDSSNTTQFEIDPGTYKLSGFDQELTLELGGVYTILVNSASKEVKSFTITNPNSVHILWLLPQYFVITAGEILFAITGLEFSYSQAPESMKSVLQAAWLLTMAFGNLIIVIIESAKIFDKQSSDFFLYTGLMVADMIIFAFMAMKYKYVEKDEESKELNGDLASSEDEKKISNAIDNPTFDKDNN